MSVRVSSDAEVSRLRTELDLERRARRHRVALQELAAATSRVVTRRGVAEAITERASDLLDTGWASVAYVGEDDIIHFVHGPNMPEVAWAEWSEAPLDTDVPVASVLRGDAERLELTDRGAISGWPLLTQEIDRLDMGSLIIEPVPADGARPLAAIALAWPDSHTMDELERELLEEVIEAATPAFERARRTELDREVARTMQDWLLPASVPDLERLDIAALYRPARGDMAVGGDWYDVLRLSDDTAAIVVGDVVGHDARAAAEMGQVRHVLASQLFSTRDVAAALTATDRYFFARSVDTMATALVMVFHADDGRLELASAGHLPPIVREPDRASETIECGLGPPIGSGLGGHVGVDRILAPDSVLVAFTDGIVERRDRTIDESLGAFCAEIDRCRSALGDAWRSPRSGARIMKLLRDLAGQPWRRDDVAAVVARHRRAFDQP